MSSSIFIEFEAVQFNGAHHHEQHSTLFNLALLPRWHLPPPVVQAKFFLSITANMVSVSAQATQTKQLLLEVVTDGLTVMSDSFAFLVAT
jgi:hypothetical protein